jgi:hypothetical protein
LTDRSETGTLAKYFSYIRELEGHAVPGVFLQILVETEQGSDEEF